MASRNATFSSNFSIKLFSCAMFCQFFTLCGYLILQLVELLSSLHYLVQGRRAVSQQLGLAFIWIRNVFSQSDDVADCFTSTFLEDRHETLLPLDVTMGFCKRHPRRLHITRIVFVRSANATHEDGTIFDSHSKALKISERWLAEKPEPPPVSHSLSLATPSVISRTTSVRALVGSLY